MIHDIMKASRYSSALHKLDSELRAIMKHGDAKWLEDADAIRFLEELRAIIHEHIHI